MYSIVSHGHRIDIEYSWTGKEKIVYDDRVVSEKRSIFGAVHSFEVHEDDELVYYEIKFSPGMTDPRVVVRRNGVIIFLNDEEVSPAPRTNNDSPSTTPQVPPAKETIIKEVILVVCPHCSHRNESSRRSCEKCGASI